jgi:uncharacterized protein
MKRAFVDTSAWFAYVNRADPDHSAVRRVLREHEGRLISSNVVFDEVVTLCRYRLGHGIARKIGSVLLDPTVADVVRVTADDEHAAWELFNARGDQEYSFTDCTSFALMRRLKVDTAVAVDHDFETEGFITLPQTSR